MKASALSNNLQHCLVHEHGMLLQAEAMPFIDCILPASLPVSATSPSLQSGGMSMLHCECADAAQTCTVCCLARLNPVHEAPGLAEVVHAAVRKGTCISNVFCCAARVYCVRTGYAAS